MRQPIIGTATITLVGGCNAKVRPEAVLADSELLHGPLKALNAFRGEMALRRSGVPQLPNSVVRPVAAFMPDYLDQLQNVTPSSKRTFVQYKLEFSPKGKPNLARALRSLLHEHYGDQDQLRRLLQELSHERAAALIVRDFAPIDHSVRFGDIGEILLVAFIESALGVPVPLRRFRQRENRRVPLPGDDAVGLMFENNHLTFVKGEAKAHKAMNSGTLQKAWTALKANGGRPSRIAVLKIEQQVAGSAPKTSRALLRYLFKEEKASYHHVTFTMYETITQGAATELLKKVWSAFPHYVIGIKLSDSEKLVSKVFARAIAPK